MRIVLPVITQNASFCAMKTTRAVVRGWWCYPHARGLTTAPGFQSASSEILATSVLLQRLPWSPALLVKLCLVAYSEKKKLNTACPW